MELRHIRYFLAVAAERNISRAAKQVGIGQPPLSLQIRDLEREVGSHLFHRIPQGVELTAAGQAFHKLVQDIPNQVERAVHCAQRAERGDVGALAVGYTASAVLSPHFSAAIRCFRRAYPGVALILRENNTTVLIKWLLESDLDLVFTRRLVLTRLGETDPENLRMRVLSEEPLLAALPARHPAARNATLNLADLRQETFVMFPREANPSAFDAVMAACHKLGFAPRLGPSVPQFVSIVHLVAAEVGVSLVPAALQNLQIKDVVFREVKDVPLMSCLSLAWRPTDTSPFLKNFLGCTLA
jgi:DNA-binding transcriptional LysR family regulator